MVEVASAGRRTSKRDLLMDWMRDRGLFATHDIIAWGMVNYYNRAIQTKADLIREGYVIKLDDKEKEIHGYRCKDEVYRWAV